MKNILAATSIAMFLLSPVAMAQSADMDSDEPVASGGAAGSDDAQIATHATIAGVGAAALIGGAFALSNSHDDDDNVNLGGGSTGTTGTNGGGTGTTGTN